MDALLGVLIQLALYGLVVLTFFAPIEAFLRFRLRQAARRGDPHAYLALSDPWVAPIVALAGMFAIALVRVIS